MHWWNSFIDWTGSAHGWRLLSGAIIPFVAIVVAGIVAALIGRGATKRVVAMQEREAKNAAVAGVISAARKAATWGTLGHDERSYADHLAEDADIRLRLLPVAGAPVAANWAQHEIADIKKHSSTFSFQAEQSLAEFRDRMLDWQARPSRARKLFRADLERWKFETPDPNADLVQRQQEWNADQADARGGATTADAGTPSTTGLRVPRRGTAGSATTGAASAGAASASAAAATATGEAGAGTAPAGTAPAGGVMVGSGRPARPQPIAPALPRVDRAPGADRAPEAIATDAPASGDDRDRDHGSDTSAGTTADERTPGALVPAVAAARPATPARTAVLSPVGPASHDEPEDDARPTAALTEPKVDAAGPVTTNTTSIPTRIPDGPVEHADPHETDEAPHGAPLTAAELRRRGELDED